jgi:hypothetical protein
MYLGLASLKLVRMVPKFRIFSEQKVKKPRKLAKSLKIFFSRTTGEQKNSFIFSLRGPFSSLFEATSCDQYFFFLLQIVRMYENHNFNAQ